MAKKIKDKEAKENKEEIKITWLDQPAVINGKKWLTGVGPMPAKIMIIGDKPTYEDYRNEICMGGKTRAFLLAITTRCDILLKNCYLTYAVKYVTKKNPTAKDIKICNPLLLNEIRKVNPDLIVCLGRSALEAVLTKKRAISDYRGVFIPFDTIHTAKPVMVLPTYTASHVANLPAVLAEAERDWDLISEYAKNGSVKFDKTDVFVLDTLDKLVEAVDIVLDQGDEDKRIELAIDAEWEGKHWQDPAGYIRTFQFTSIEGMASVVELYNTDGKPLMDIQDAMRQIKRLLTSSRVDIIGHNIISDGEWLISYGIDIRPRVTYDTMLAEHIINMLGPFGLEALAVKYTRLGRYDVALLDWKNEHPDMVKKGYGKIPRDILIPYAGTDVDATLRIKHAQEEALKPYMVPRGEYPSLWDIVLHTQNTLYELQMTGIAVDNNRLIELTKIYNDKLIALESRILEETSRMGVDNFNFNSPIQVANVIFNVLKIAPVETTGGKPWEWVLDQLDEVAEEATPSTDKKVLDILQDEHIFIKLMRDARKLEHVCKTWLIPDDAFKPDEHDETSKGGGLRSKIWPDGKIHARFSQLKETGRFSSSKPNMQNFPKKSEEDMKRIFGKDNIPPAIKTIFIPDPGYVLMEADYKQAELFVLAYLSGDSNMINMLTTPGKDLHDATTIKSFDIKVTYPDGSPALEEQLIDIAKKSGEKALKKTLSTLIYTDARGKIMTRDEFKSSVRTSGKNINFGLPYGRGAEAIALQVKAETGSPKSIQELKSEIQKGIDAWKNDLYPDAWRYMTKCSQAVANPGYLINPWGRVRLFPRTDDQKLIAAMGREAQNFNVQSAVADTVMVAFWLINNYRIKHGLSFKIVNQVHDSLVFHVPISEIDATKEMIYQTMGNITIPIENNPLILAVEIDVMNRWGEKAE